MVVLTVSYALASSHHLQFARANDGPVSHAVFVFERALDDEERAWKSAAEFVGLLRADSLNRRWQAAMELSAMLADGEVDVEFRDAALVESLVGALKDARENPDDPPLMARQVLHIFRMLKDPRSLEAHDVEEHHLGVMETKYEVADAKVVGRDDFVGWLEETLGPWSRVDLALWKVKGAEFQKGGKKR